MYGTLEDKKPIGIVGTKTLMDQVVAPMMMRIKMKTKRKTLRMKTAKLKKTTLVNKEAEVPTTNLAVEVINQPREKVMTKKRKLSRFQAIKLVTNLVKIWEDPQYHAVRDGALGVAKKAAADRPLGVLPNCPLCSGPGVWCPSSGPTVN